jgi:hypothetical protein
MDNIKQHDETRLKVKQIIQLDAGNGIMFETEIERPTAVDASFLGGVKPVHTSLEEVTKTFRAVTLPFLNTWRELSRDVELSEATVKVGIGLTASGNFIITKGEASANVELEIKFSSKKTE